MKQNTNHESKFGINRTGINSSPIDSQKVIDEANRRNPSSLGNGVQIKQLRSIYYRLAEPVGNVPVPSSIKGVASAGTKNVTGLNLEVFPEVIIDKLGERLAFERSGIRLYEAFLAKCETFDNQRRRIPMDQFQRFREEELQHFLWVEKSMRTLGADPTAITPSADVTSVASSGLIQVITDPRTSLTQCLQSLLVAELADQSGWELLIQLADEMGFESMVSQFRIALSEEREHLDTVLRLYNRLVLDEAKVAA